MTLINVLIYTAFVDSLCLLFVAFACLVVACFRGSRSRLWDAAFITLFEELDELGCYEDINRNHKALYDAAKLGDAKAAHELLTLRQRYEYEGWYVRDVL